MNLDFSGAELEALEDALTDCLVYDNDGDRDVQCEILARVRNALERQPASTAASVRAWVDRLRAQYELTGSCDLDS